MPRSASFWRNVGIIGALHVAVLAGLMKWSDRTKSTAPSNVLWMDGGALDEIPVVAAAQVAAPAEPESDPIVLPAPPETPPDELSASPPPAVPSEMEMPTPAAIAPATPRPTPLPTASLPVKSSPKPPPTPKKALAKASPTASPKAAATVVKKSPAPAAKKISVKADSPASATPAGSAAAAGKGAKEGTAGEGGQGSGPGGASQFGWYASMLHDRFFSEWAQPTTVVATGPKMSALVRIRIEKDGRVSSFEIVKPSGNVVVDESVAAVAKKVTQVDPLPPGLGAAGHYDVKINFELD